MTITQLAATAGCSRDTVKRMVKTVYPLLKSRGKGIALELDEEQCINIMGLLPKKNFISEPNANAPSLLVQNNQVDYVEIGKMIAMAVTSAMTPILQELRQPQINNALQIEHVPEKPSRAIFRQHVDKLVKLANSDWSTIYNAVYSEMGYVYNVKIKARANKRGVKPIDVLESDGYMGKAIAVTRQMIERLEK